MLLPIPDETIKNLLAYLAGKKNFVFLETCKPSPDNHRSLLFLDPVKRLRYTSTSKPESFFKQAQDYLEQGYFLAGWFAYEFSYTLESALTPFQTEDDDCLADLGVFPPPLIFDHRDGCFGQEPPFTGASAKVDAHYQIDNLHPSLSRDEYLACLAKIMEYLEAGDTYQVNYTLKLLFEFTGSPEALYLALRHSQPVPYSAYLRFDETSMLSLSPELFFRKEGQKCTVRPMKGTLARGRTLSEDRGFANFLRNDIKNRSENVMIVDLLRNDLGRLSKMASVTMDSMFDVETYASLHQMTSTITGSLRDQTSFADIFKALFPCGSVTGAPKIRTMEIINELEQDRRGIYTGALGFISPDGDAEFNVPIRTVVLNGRNGEIGIGAGITHDSKPEAEWQESLLKGNFLSRPQPDFQVIETILWRSGKGFWLLDLHLTRLTESCSYFDFPFNQEDIIHDLDEAVTLHKENSLRVRLLLHRDGRIEVSATPCKTPPCLNLPQTAEPLTKLPQITISSQPVDSCSPFLYHKTTVRELFDGARQQAVEAGYLEVIFVNKEGEVTEGSFSNIMIKENSNFYTPPQECGLLAGVCRRYLLEKYPETVSEKKIRVAELHRADAIYITNSVRGMVQVRLEGFTTDL